MLLGLISCSGGVPLLSSDCANLSSDPPGSVQTIDDGFDGTGPLLEYVTNNPDSLPDVGRVDGRYNAVVLDNSEDQTLHFYSAQGRLDARLVSFPFDYVARNIGIGTVDDPQVAPEPIGDDTYIFAGVQVHDLDLEARNSSHILVGHRGPAHFTVEGKNTCAGDSAVDDAGSGVAPTARADLRIVGTADRTLEVYYQDPNPDVGNQPDDWQLYNGTGRLPGTSPDYGEFVYVGLITAAQGQTGVPYVGTADSVEDYSESALSGG